MNSTEEKKPRDLVRKIFPFLYKTCPAENKHFITERYCYCRLDEYYITIDPKKRWKGGIYDFKTKEEVFFTKDKLRHPTK